MDAELSQESIATIRLILSFLINPLGAKNKKVKKMPF